MIQLNRCMQPPVESFVPQGATLYCELASSNAEVVTVTYRFIDTQAGQIFVDSVANAVVTLPTTFDVKANLPEGFLISVTARSDGTEQRGETFVKVKLKGKDGRDLVTLLRGYLTAKQQLTFPPVHLEQSQSGMGSMQRLVVGGALYHAFDVPPGQLWRPKSLYASNLAGAVVADRLAYVDIMGRLGVGVYAHIPAHDVQGADVQAYWLFAKGVESRTLLVAGEPDTKYIITALPDIDLRGEYRLYFDVAGFDAGDTIGETNLIYEQLLMPDGTVTQ